MLKSPPMTKSGTCQLSVNINKLATIRNSRGKNNPDVVATALDIVRFGAQGITVHPRPDGRHIRRADVHALKEALPQGIEFNIEGFPSPDFCQMVLEVKPDQCTLVPDPPEALTSNAGWRVQENRAILEKTAAGFAAAGIRTSVFVDPQTIRPDEYPLLSQIGVQRIELYTERFAETFATPAEAQVLAGYRQSAMLARASALGVNAGHDLDSKNLAALLKEIPWIDEVSIGHALICDALYWGLQKTIEVYLQAIAKGQGQSRH